MSRQSTFKNQSRVQNWLPLFALAVFLLSLAAYFGKFHGPLSDEHDTWGQFGDFMGGVVNPIVGLCTIWLLVISLGQNQIALRQAHEELELAREALEGSKDAQRATEAALREQVSLAQKSHDMNNTLALWTGLVNQASYLRGVIASTSGTYFGGPENDQRKPFQDKLNGILAQIELLNELKDIEVERLVAKKREKYRQ